MILHLLPPAWQFPGALPITAPDTATVLSAQKLALLLARTMAVFSFFPLGLELAPQLVRASLCLVCTLALYSTAPPVAEGSFVLQVLSEVAVGLCAGLCARLPLAAVEAGMQINSVSSGLGIASLMDPATEDEVHALTELTNYAGLVVFFAVSGHHRMLLALAESLRRVPPGAATLSPQVMMAVVRLGSEFFLIAVQLAAPLILTALALNLSLGLLSRAAPAANIFAINLVAVLLVGLMVLTRALPALGPTLQHAAETTAGYFILLYPARTGH